MVDTDWTQWIAWVASLCEPLASNANGYESRSDLPAPLRHLTDQIFTAELISLWPSADGIFIVIKVTEMMLT